MRLDEDVSVYDRNQGPKPFMEQFVRADLVVEQVWIADQAFSVERAPGLWRALTLASNLRPTRSGNDSHATRSFGSRRSDLLN